jgi:hypothetical protein
VSILDAIETQVEIGITTETTDGITAGIIVETIAEIAIGTLTENTLEIMYQLLEIHRKLFS